MKKSAFTMLELVFVIVVVGVLSVVFIPRFERDNAGEAAYQIARHIRLAQHHALVEDKFDNSSDWQKEFWQIAFTHSTVNDGDCYDVYSDRNRGGNVNSSGEAAIDPLSKRQLYSNNCNEGTTTNNDILLWKSFGVNSITFSTGCGGNKLIAFDNLGRPYAALGTNPTQMTQLCTLTLTTKDNHSATINVYPNTGFVKVATIDGITLP